MAPLGIEYGFGLIIRSPYTPYSMYLRGTIDFHDQGVFVDLFPGCRARLGLC